MKRFFCFLLSTLMLLTNINISNVYAVDEETIDYSKNVTTSVTYNEDNTIATINISIQDNDTLALVATPDEASDEYLSFSEDNTSNEGHYTSMKYTTTTNGTYSFDVSVYDMNIGEDYLYTGTTEASVDKIGYKDETVPTETPIASVEPEASETPQVTETPETSNIPEDNSDNLNTVDGAEALLDVVWQSTNSNYLPNLYLYLVGGEQKVSVNATFPSDAKDKVITVTSNTAVTAYGAALDSSYGSVKETDTSLPVTNEVSSNTGKTTTFKALNSTFTYTINQSASQVGFNFSVANGRKDKPGGWATKFNDNRNQYLLSNGATNTKDCVTVHLEYTDSNDKKHEVNKTLSIGYIEKAVPTVGFNNYKSADDPQTTLKDATQSSANLIAVNWYGENENGGSRCDNYAKVFLKNMKVTFTATKGLGIVYTDQWTEYGERIDNNDGTETITAIFNKGYDNYNAPYSSGVDFAAFYPKVTFPDTAKNGDKFQLHVVSMEIVQLEDFVLNEDGTVTGQEKTYTFNKEGGYGTAYYEVQDYSNMFVLGFTAGDNYSITKSAYDKTLNDVDWYNPEYPEMEDIVSMYYYGNYGTRDITTPKTIKLKFDTENTGYIGVRALRLAMDSNSYTNIMANGSYDVWITTTKNSTLHKVTVNNLIGGKQSSSYCIYLDADALGLAEGEYLKEIRYEVSSIKASTQSGLTTGQNYEIGKTDYSSGWVIGKILTASYGTDVTYKSTVQIFNDSNCSEAATDEGTITSVIGNQKRVSIRVNQVTSNKSTIAAGDTITLNSSIAYYETDSKYFDGKVLGYAPVTEIYVRDMFGTGISNLNIKNNYTGNYLVQDGQAKDGVTVVEIDPETASSANNNFAVRVFKVTIDHNKTLSKYDNVVGHYQEVIDNKANLTGASISVSWKTTIPLDIEEDSDHDGLANRIDERYDMAQSLYVVTDCGIEQVNGINFQLHTGYGGSSGYRVVHSDTFDVNRNQTTDFADPCSKTGSIQGDYLVVRANKGTTLCIKQPEKRTDLAIENWFKESDARDSSYRTYDSKSSVDTTVNLGESNATMKLLVTNYSTADIKYFDLFVIIPKEGQTWGSDSATYGFYSDKEGFKFSANLTGEMTNPDSSTFTITYGKVDPARVETDLMTSNIVDGYDIGQLNVNLYSYDELASNDIALSDVNIIRIHTDELPKSSGSSETGKEQAKRSMYFTAPITYGSESVPEETEFDIWKAMCRYYSDNGSSHGTNWYNTSYFGLRAKDPSFTVNGYLTLNGVQQESTIGTVTPTSEKVKNKDKVTANVSITDDYKNYYTVVDDTSKFKITVTDIQSGEVTTLKNTDDTIMYTYDSKSGQLVINSDYVTGNINIEVPIEPRQYVAKVTTPNGSHGDSTDTPTYGTDYSTQVTPNTGYEVPTDKTNITVKVNGRTLEPEEFEYRNGKVTVPGNKVTGNIEITVPCTKKVFAATAIVQLNGKTISDERLAKVSINNATPSYGDEVVATVNSLDSNYHIVTGQISVTVGNTDTNKKYNSSNKTVTVSGSDVTNNVSIIIPIAANTYKATTKVVDANDTSKTAGTHTKSTTAPTYGIDYWTQVTPSTGYELPTSTSDIIVKVGNSTLGKDEFTYVDGKVTITGTKITGNIEITVPCTLKTFTATVTTPNGTHRETTTTPTYGQPYTTKVDPNTNYELPKDKIDITVTVDGKTLNSEDFDYNPSTGEVTVHGDKVTGNITINVPSTPKKFTVTTTVTNGIQTVGSNSDTPVYGTNYNTTVKPNEHYEYPSTITVTVGDKTLTVGDDYTYNSSTGEISVNGDKITGNIVITVVCTKEPYKVTGIDEYVSGSNKYVVSVTDASLGTEKPEFAGVADITVNKEEINENESVSATLKITSPNFTLDKDNVYVEITDYDGNSVATYNYSDKNSKVTIVKEGETKGITSGSNPLIKLSLTNKFTKLTTGPVTLHEDKVPRVYESYTITVDGSVVKGNVKFYTPIVAKVTSDTEVVNGTETGNTAEGSTTNAVVNIPIDNSATGLGLKTQVYESDVKANSGKLLPSTVDSNVKVTIGGVELTGVLLSNIDEASTLTDDQFGYLPVKDSNGKYTEAKVIVPSLDLLKTIYPNLAVIIKVVPYDEPSSKTSSSTGTSPHVTCEQYMRSDKWTWSEATQSCVLKVTTSDGYVVPNTADK